MTDSDKSFHIILYQPEIPNNTGNIGRTCVATNCHLHLIGPLGFDIGEKQVRRAGLDYWQYLTLTYHENYEAFCRADHGIERFFYFTTKATQNYSDVEYKRGDGLMFGPETRGLPESFWKDRSAQCFKIPMIGPTRSLNLSNAVSIVSYEGLRQLGTGL